jgi:hypothetical protein
MRTFQKADRSLRAVRADRDPARSRRDGGDEPALGWVGFDHQQGFGFLLAHRSSSRKPTQKK